MPGSLDDMLGGDLTDGDTPPDDTDTEADPDSSDDDEFSMHAKDFLDTSNDEQTRVEALRMAIQALSSASGGGSA